ncbi:MAG TPA: hypothetical protein VHP14_01920, partial [Anaerolineales bacterium]|nr:hypothetical protein [Anaerolineales bacterium]
SLFFKRLQRGTQTFVHGNIVQKTCNAKDVIDLRRGITQLHMRHLEVFLFWCEDLIDLLERPHSRAAIVWKTMIFHSN